MTNIKYSSPSCICASAPRLLVHVLVLVCRAYCRDTRDDNSELFGCLFSAFCYPRLQAHHDRRSRCTELLTKTL